MVVSMRDNHEAGEYKSEDIVQFLDSKGVRSHFSTLKKQWHNGSAESAINSIVVITKTVSLWWLNPDSVVAGKDARNETFKERIGMKPYQAMYAIVWWRERWFRIPSFRMQSVRIPRKAIPRERKYTPKAKEAVYVGLVPNMSLWGILDPGGPENNCIESSKVRWAWIPLLQDDDGGQSHWYSVTTSVWYHMGSVR